MRLPPGMLVGFSTTIRKVVMAMAIMVLKHPKVPLLIHTHKELDRLLLKLNNIVEGRTRIWTLFLLLLPELRIWE
jgi:hypothetical protein